MWALSKGQTILLILSANALFALNNTNTTANNLTLLTFQQNGSGMARIGSVNLDSNDGALTVQVKDAGSFINALYVSNIGNVGIENPSPRGTLDVAGQIIAVNRMTLAQDTGTSTTTWHFDNSSGLFRLFWRPNINTGGTVVMAATTAGNVGIGTIDPQYPLAVNGVIQAKEVLVNTGWSDYVFEPNYRLQPLTEVAAFIKANHHLPGIPSQAEVQAKGVSVGEMESKLLAKVEELTVHMIQLEQENKALAQKVAGLEKQ